MSSPSPTDPKAAKPVEDPRTSEQTFQEQIEEALRDAGLADDLVAPVLARLGERFQGRYGLVDMGRVMTMRKSLHVRSEEVRRSIKHHPLEWVIAKALEQAESFRVEFAESKDKELESLAIYG